jgi:hypothetical protein
MMWFARGRLWQSEEEAREALIRQRMERDRRRAPAGGDRARPRGRDWRPGGQHKDPRDRFKVPRDVKRARFKARLRRPPDAGGAKPRVPFRKPFKKKDEE